MLPLYVVHCLKLVAFKEIVLACSAYFGGMGLGVMSITLVKVSLC